MSDAPAGKGGFGQFAAQYRDRWAASHPERSKELEPSVAVPHPLDRTANVVPAAIALVPDGVAPTAPHRHTSATSAAPFGRRRVRPS